jgi:predicted RNA-binding protein with PIN domain
MPLHIITDGYGSVAGLRGNLHARREPLIGDLAEYRRTRGYPITIVFEGNRRRLGRRERRRLERLRKL